MMTTALPRTDLEPAWLDLEVTCQRCDHVPVVDDRRDRV